MLLKNLLLEKRDNIESMIIASEDMTYSSSNISKLDLIPTGVGSYSLVLNEVVFDFTDEELEKEGELVKGVFYFDLGRVKIELTLR